MLPRSPSEEIRAALAQRLVPERLLNRVSRIAYRVEKLKTYVPESLPCPLNRFIPNESTPGRFCMAVLHRRPWHSK